MTHVDATPLPSAGDAVPCGAMPRKPAPPPKPSPPLPPSLRLLLLHAREAAGLSRGELAARLADAHGEADSRRWRRLIERYEAFIGRGQDGLPQEPTLATATAVATALGLELNIRLVPRRDPAAP